MPLDDRLCIAVAYSGGRDSTALLHATARAALDIPGLRVFALHVHHGLSPHADEWLDHAKLQCSQWLEQGLPVSLLSRRVDLKWSRGDSVESVARHVRYRALAEMATEVGAQAVWLAHHQRDQAETFLLQALRGAGLAGLASMPQSIVREGVIWERPWLKHSRQAIEAYVAHHGLSFVEDDSNSNQRFARNRIRLSVWPHLVSAFEQAERALVQSAARTSDAQSCLDDWVGGQLSMLTLNVGEGGAAGALDAHAFAQRRPPHQRELLRHWFFHQTGRRLAASSVTRITAELPSLIGSGRSIRWRAGAFDVCLFKGALTCRCSGFHETEKVSGSDALVMLRLSEPGHHVIPNARGKVVVKLVDSGGISLERLSAVALRPRQGGEDFKLAPNRPSRSLRKQFQSQGVPVWDREAPLFYSDGGLIFVPGLGMDARALAGTGVPQATLTWVSDLTI